MAMDADRLAAEVKKVARARLRAAHERLRHCVDQLDDDALWWRPVPEQNSVANILLHLAGNLQQWIVAGVGELPDDRDRPGEFAERGPLPRQEVLSRLERVIEAADRTIASLTAEQLVEERRIQGFGETVCSALFDSIGHLQGHQQEIVYIARLQLQDRYRFFWGPATPEEGAPPADDDDPL